MQAFKGNFRNCFAYTGIKVLKAVFCHSMYIIFTTIDTVVLIVMD